MTAVSRRDFLQGSAGLVIVFAMPSTMRADGDEETQHVLNAWLRISTHGTVTIYATHPEMGQGVGTALPMIVAEELDIPWQRVVVEQAPVDNTRFGRQVSAGSQTVASTWLPLRNAGATARQLLIDAAAKTWGVPAIDLRTDDGQVRNPATGDALDYGQLAATAATLPQPAQVGLKNPGQFRLLGKRVPGVDNRAIATGAQRFGIDKQLPGLRHATYVRAPAIGARMRSTNIDELKKLNGVVDAFILEEKGAPRGLRGGIAIVADSTWHALRARGRLEVDWDLASAVADDWRRFRREAMDTAKHLQGDEVFADGDVDAAFADAEKVVEGTYVYPFLPHATLEPQNCTAWVRGNGAEIWAPTQNPQGGASLAASICGLDEASVKVYPMRCGGGFGRRLVNDAMVEAVAISQRAGAPVKLLWTREDDFAHDFYRPGGVHHVRGAIGENSEVSAWQTHFVTISRDGHSTDRWTGYSQSALPRELIPNYRVGQSIRQFANPTGAWRAPGANTMAFVVNSFLHELSNAAGRDHGEFLLSLMGEPRQLRGGRRRTHGLHTGRAATVIKAVMSRAGWGTRLPTRRGLGLAFNFGNGGYFAEIADVSVAPDKRIVVHKVWVVADVGQIVNLSMAEHQCVGSVTDGLSAMLGLRADFSAGAMQQGNFHQYPLLRMPAAPQVDVHFVASDRSPTGLGEPALPPIAPAVCNAIFAATGDRVRELPLSESGYRV